jgi:putative lipoprotein
MSPASVLGGALAGLLVLGAASCASGGATPPSPSASVSGTIAYRERVALPPAAVIKVQLVDVSRADAPATVLGEQVIEAGGKQVPFAFAIPYDPAAIEPSHSYAVQARIEVDGQLRFINDQRYAVITRGAPTRVDLVLKSVGGPAPR